MSYSTAGDLCIDRLYRYNPFKEGYSKELFESLLKGSICFSNPANFNDPWDCRPFYNTEILNNSVEYDKHVQWFERIDRERYPHKKESVRIAQIDALRDNVSGRFKLESHIYELSEQMWEVWCKKYRIYCLTEHNDSILMWAHYGDNHKGICLEFAVKPFFITAIKIKYEKRYPIYKIYNEELEKELRPFITKYDMWQYEDEFRMFSTEWPEKVMDYPQSKNSCLSFPTKTLKAVIVGCKMPVKDIEKVKCLILKSRLKVALKKAEMVPNEYKLEIKEIGLS